MLGRTLSNSNVIMSEADKGNRVEEGSRGIRKDQETRADKGRWKNILRKDEGGWTEETV